MSSPTQRISCIGSYWNLSKPHLADDTCSKTPATSRPQVKTMQSETRKIKKHDIAHDCTLSAYDATLLMLFYILTSIQYIHTRSYQYIYIVYSFPLPSIVFLFNLRFSRCFRVQSILSLELYNRITTGQHYIGILAVNRAIWEFVCTLLSLEIIHIMFVWVCMYAILYIDMSCKSLCCT